MNHKEIKEKLREMDITPSILSDMRVEKPTKYQDQKDIDFVSIFGYIKEVVHEGGEGQGDNYTHVWYFIDHDVYLRVDAFYSSYNGVDYDGCDFEWVIPKEKMIIVYVKPEKDDLRDMKIKTVIE